MCTSLSVCSNVAIVITSTLLLLKYQTDTVNRCSALCSLHSLWHLFFVSNFWFEMNHFWCGHSFCPNTCQRLTAISWRPTEELVQLVWYRNSLMMFDILPPRRLCLFGLYKNYWTDLHQTWWRDEAWHQFWIRFFFSSEVWYIFFGIDLGVLKVLFVDLVCFI